MKQQKPKHSENGSTAVRTAAHLRVRRMLIAAIVMVAISLAAGTLMLRAKHSAPQAAAPPPAQPAVTQAPPPAQPHEVTVSWLAQPVKIDGLQYISRDPSLAQPVLAYYKVGTAESGEAVILAADSSHILQPQLFLQKPGGNAAYLLRHNSLSSAEGTLVAGIMLAKIVQYDTTTNIKAIAWHGTLPYQSATLETGRAFDFATDSVGFRSDFARPAIKDSNGTLYEVTNVVGGGYNVVSYMSAGTDFRARLYRVKLPLSFDKGILQITWSDGSKNSKPFQRALLPCSLPAGDAIATDVTEADLDTAGRLANGQIVYVEKSAQSRLQQALYKRYAAHRASTAGAGASVMDLEQFHGLKAAVLLNDSLNRYVIFADQNLVGGCV